MKKKKWAELNTKLSISLLQKVEIVSDTTFSSEVQFSILLLFCV